MKWNFKNGSSIEFKGGSKEFAGTIHLLEFDAPACDLDHTVLLNECLDKGINPIPCCPDCGVQLMKSYGLKVAR